MVRHKTKPVERTRDFHTSSNELVLYNDSVNTFEFVIEALVEVCSHDFEQAEQCTLIAHFKGKCAVKKGTYDVLKIMANELSDRKLTVAIE
jgi:ATP-dependent Clp protease adaptor protein ClpS